jgi:predicted ATPase/class 3 adenylate cyclase
LHERSEVRTYLFTDIEGSTRMWEEDPERMRPALARHDIIARSTVEKHRGVVVKMTGDGLHAVFEDPLDALGATLELQQALADPQATAGVALNVRCGLHAGADERRDNDFYGTAVNRAARIMSAAHGGQVLLSQAVAAMLGERLPGGVALRDLGSVRLRDLALPERVFQLVHPELRRDFPALRSLEATPNNLPQQLTSFIGREAELVNIKTLLAESRLLTLFGVGGIGKTRLSLQVAAEVIDDFPDGVWFIELATLRDARLVPQAVASVLGVKEAAGRPVLEALLKFFRNRHLLLILDNCEHLLQACAELAKQALQASPHSKVLASSREPLHVAGETTYLVPALALPEAHGRVTLWGLVRSEAVRLFLDRAVAAKPGFRVNGDAEALASVCRRLDGIPLAIELAAARVRTLSVNAIATRLDDRFRLLTRGDQTALPRQQTLRALIDWSYDLLTEGERAVFRRLAVFAGGLTLEAAEAVAASGFVNKTGTLDHVTQLAEKSLIVVEAGGERYRLLETVRQYALERLTESHEADAARTRHLGYYLALAEKARPGLAGPQQGEWLALLDTERENLLEAHAWCDHARDGSGLGLKLVYLLRPYWLNRGLLGLGQRVSVEALARPGAKTRNFDRCRGLFVAGQLTYFMGRYSEAQQYLRESLAIAREIDDKRRTAVVLQPLGMAYLGQGELATARQYLQEAVASAESLGEPRELAAATNALAQLYRVEGSLDEAEPLYEKVLALARQVGDRESIAIGLLNFAMVVISRGEDDQARRMLLDVLAIAQEIGSKPAGQSLLEVCAGLAALREDWPRAARFYGAAEAQAGQTGIHRDPSDEAFLAPLVAKAQAALGTEAFAAAEDGGRALTYAAALEEARAWLAAARPR